MNAIRIKNVDRKFSPFNSSILPWAGLANTVFRILEPGLAGPRSIFKKKGAHYGFRPDGVLMPAFSQTEEWLSSRLARHAGELTPTQVGALTC
jgi:hypothetical protein